MWKWVALVLFVCVGCDSDFYRQDTATWFGFPPPQKNDKAPKDTTGSNQTEAAPPRAGE
jgi:hypothetical protein